MKMYNVILTCLVTVEAENPKDAKEAALMLLADGEVVPTDIEIGACE